MTGLKRCTHPRALTALVGTSTVRRLVSAAREEGGARWSTLEKCTEWERVGRTIADVLRVHYVGNDVNAQYKNKGEPPAPKLFLRDCRKCALLCSMSSQKSHLR